MMSASLFMNLMDDAVNAKVRAELPQFVIL